MFGDLCYSASPSGSVSVGSFYYRKQTLTKVGCVFVLLCLPLLADSVVVPCVCACVCVCVYMRPQVMIY